MVKRRILDFGFSFIFLSLLSRSLPSLGQVGAGLM
jgi:hypothetical protein